MPDNPDAFLERLVDDLRPVKPMRQGNGMALSLSALLLGVLLVILLLGVRSDLADGHPDPLVLTAAGLFLVLALASSWAAIDMARPAVGTRRDGWGWTALMAAVLPLSAMGLAAIDVLSARPVPLDHGGVACLALGCLVGLLTAAALVAWLRRGAPSSPHRAGLLTGVAAGAAGIFAVSLWCSHDDLMHIGIWHGATVIVFGLIGRLVLPRVLAW